MTSRPTLLVSRMIFLDSRRLPLRELCLEQFNDPRPFAPPPLQGLHHYYERVRPCIPIRARYRFSRSLSWPDLGSRCLNTGCHTDSKQISSVLIRAGLYRPLLTSPKISMLHRTVHFRSTSQVPRDGSVSAFSQIAHHRTP